MRNWVCLVFMFTFISAMAEGTEEGRQYCSGTLPIMFIHSDAPIVNREDYINATCYIDALGQDGYESMGSADSPISLQIKGRGNYTWKVFDKKPYRLKFAKEVRPLGMKENRHFILLSHPDDLATDQEEITGGWLIEIDNYQEAGQIQLSDSKDDDLRFTVHSPRNMSNEQYRYISEFLKNTDKAVFSSDESCRAWEDYIDIDTLARYYIVREIVDDAESFRGSCFIHKERKHGKEDTKLIFGPVWDFGFSFQRGHDNFIWEYPPYGAIWIGDIYKSQRFQDCVKDIWRHFLATQYPKLNQAIDDFIDRIRHAYDCNMARWPQSNTGPIDNRKMLMKQCLTKKVKFLTREWGR